MPRRSSSHFIALVAFRTEAAIVDRLDALAVKFSTKLHEANRSDVAGGRDEHADHIGRKCLPRRDGAGTLQVSGGGDSQSTVAPPAGLDAPIAPA